MVRLLLGFVFALLMVGNANAVTVQRVVSDGGLEAWLVEDHANPIVSLKFSFRGGAALDPDDKLGLARMAASTMDEGAGALDSMAFQSLLQDKSITLTFTAGLDTFSGNVQTLSENLDEALDMLRQALTVPRFDPEPVERIRRQILSSLRQNEEDPGAVAGKKLFAALYPNHPYGRPSDGTIDGVEAVTTDDLKTFVARRLAKDNVLIGVAGDVSAPQLKGLLDKTFGALPAKAKTAPITKIEPILTGGVTVIDKAVPQASIVIAQGGVARNAPEFFTAYTLNYILGGGGFTSRLYDAVREKRGLAYSISSGLYPMDHSAMMMVSAGTANESAAETLAVIRAEWQRMAETGVTQGELSDAKTYLTGSFPLRFSSLSQISSILVGMQVQRLGIDYLEKRNSYVDAVTLEGVNTLAAKLLTTDALTAIVVGQPANLP